MKKFLAMLILSTVTAFGAGWDSVVQIKEGQKIELKTRYGAKLQGTLISATAESIAIRHKSGEQSIERTNVLRVGVYEANRKTQRVLLFTSVGAAAGLGMGVAMCPSCANEGGGSTSLAGIGIGAVFGALGGSMASPYKTIYAVK